MRNRVWMAAAAMFGLVGVAVWGMAWNSVSRAVHKGVALLPCDAGSPPIADNFPRVDRWTEDLIGKLVRVGGMNPKEWSSVKRYETTTLGSRQIAEQLNAGLIVRCRVLDGSDSVRVTLTLIEPRGESVLWNESYARAAGVGAANEVQAAAALGLAGRLGIVPSTSAVAAVNRPLTKDTMALRQYHLGLYFRDHLGPGNPEKSVRLLDSALVRDSTFAQAYPALSVALEMSAAAANSPAPRDTQLMLIRRALDMDSSIATAHSELGLFLLNRDHNWPAAEREFQQAVKLNPSSVDVHLTYGLGLHMMERRADAIREFEKAGQADPVSVISHSMLARTLLYDAQYDRALAEIRQGLALAPDAPALNHLLAYFHLRRGHPDSALATLRRIGLHGAGDAWLYAVAGDRRSAQDYLG
jgi:tetratricopeptide (TPR) repeat protein